MREKGFARSAFFPRLFSSRKKGFAKQISQGFLHQQKGFAISIDALLAMVVFIAMIAFISSEPASNLPLTQPKIAISQLVDDAIAAMDNTGFIMESIDGAHWSSIGTKLDALLPDNIAYRVEMTRYEAPLYLPDTQCRNPGHQDFETCFPYDTNIYSLGAPVPEDMEVFHGRKLFMKKEPGDCGLAEEVKEKQKWPEAFFAGGHVPEARDVNITIGDSCPAIRNPCPATDETMRCCYTYYDADSNPPVGVEYKWYRYNEATSLWDPAAETGPTYALAETDDTNRFKCSVKVSDGENPGDWGQDANSPLAIVGGPCFMFEASATGLPLECGETTTVDFTISAEAGSRQEPVDIMLLFDKSGSMSWLGRFDISEYESGSVQKSVFVDESGATDVAYVGTAGYVYKVGVNSDNGGLTYAAGDRTAIDDARSLFVSGDYVLVADGGAGLTVINKSTMAKVKTIGNIGTTRNVFVAGDYAYVVSDASSVYDPVARMAGTRNSTQYIVYNTSQAWAAQSFAPSITSIARVSLNLRRYGNPGNITAHIRQTITGPDLPNGTSAPISFTAGSYNWRNFDFPALVTVTPGQTYYIALTAPLPLSTSNYYSWGSRTVNPNGPYSPGAIYQCDSSTPGVCTAQNNEDAMFEIYYYPGFLIIDKSDANPNNWTAKSNLYNTGAGLIDDPKDVFAAGSYAYVTDGTAGDSYDGLWIVDVSNPANPAKAGYLNLTSAGGLYVSGDYAYVADGSAGLRVVNVQDKSNPTITPPFGTTVSGLGTTDDVCNYDTNAYVTASIGGSTTNSGTHVIDIANPPSASKIDTYYSPYSVAGTGNYGLFAGERYVFLAMSYGLITADRFIGPKINFARNSGKEFVGYPDWNAPLDKLGVASYNNDYPSTLNQQMIEANQANKAIVKNSIDGILAYGGTRIDYGLEKTLDEILGGNGRAEAIKFIVLLADGQCDGGCTGLSAQVLRAKNNSVYIFTIGFGADADPVQLQSIADGAYCPDKAEDDCGSYHHIDDPAALSDVYKLIAQRIAELTGRMPDKSTTDVSMEFGKFGNGIVVTDYGPDGAWDADSNTLGFDGLDVRFGWSGSFKATIPCNYVGCGDDFTESSIVDFPPAGTVISFSVDGFEQDPVEWPEKFSVNSTLYYSDLGIDFTAGKFYTANDAKVDYRISNIGYNSIDLSPMVPTVNFYQSDSPIAACQEPLNEVGSASLTGVLDAAFGDDAGPDTSVDAESSLNGSGYICIWLNKNQAVAECEENNQVKINCDIPETYIYTMDYWAWEK